MGTVVHGVEISDFAFLYIGTGRPVGQGVNCSLVFVEGGERLHGARASGGINGHGRDTAALVCSHELSSGVDPRKSRTLKKKAQLLVAETLGTMHRVVVGIVSLTNITVKPVMR